jgi:hypothetical protein
MAAISGGVLLSTIPLYLYGARIRASSFKWKLMRLIGWDADRDDVGEYRQSGMSRMEQASLIPRSLRMRSHRTALRLLTGEFQ